ncbi:SPOR domain-containing protein [Tepidibacter mesophilus]|uniref:SPOR domain-containing protein n=1 Tax=Tepidibacter mesophilus TaxID=655607 RepID=UPI000C0877E6|nr:SPOR domain-containing protein [Tepidibacter mesophilus]
MNKRYRKQRKSLLIFFLIIPLIASWATSKYVFSKLSDKKTINAVKIEVKDEIKKQINGFWIYSIQVASVNDYKEAQSIVNNLESTDIPNYVHEKEGSYKIYIYTSLKESNARRYLENIKSSYSDAFISKIQIGSMDLEYTKKYEYMNDVCKDLELMIENIKQESKFWNEYKLGTSNYDDYINLINNKSKLVDSLTKNLKKFKGKETENFEKQMSKFCEYNRKNVESVNLNLKNGNLKSCENLFLSSLFQYNEFINKIKNI